MYALIVNGKVAGIHKTFSGAARAFDVTHDNSRVVNGHDAPCTWVATMPDNHSPAVGDSAYWADGEAKWSRAIKSLGGCTSAVKAPPAPPAHSR